MKRMFEQPSYLGVATADWVTALKSSDPLERRLAAHALAEIGLERVADHFFELRVSLLNGP
jgi:hypothetical protein